MALSIGSHADVLVPNVTIKQAVIDGSYILVRLPDDGSGNPIEYWIPAKDTRVKITEILPANWPPKENDLWSVQGQSIVAFVVGDGSGGMYFVLADNVRAAYTGNETLPISTDQALSDYGTALTLLYRKV